MQKDLIILSIGLLVATVTVIHLFIFCKRIRSSMYVGDIARDDEEICADGGKFKYLNSAVKNARVIVGEDDMRVKNSGFIREKDFYGNIWDKAKHLADNNILYDGNAYEWHLRLGGKKREFVEKCLNVEQAVKDTYMESSDVELDYHKAAAVIAVCLSDEQFIRSDNAVKSGSVLMGGFILALYAALSFMEETVNEELKKSKLIDSDEYITIFLSEPDICDTPAINVMARMLAWEHSANMPDSLRVMELANTLFLIEQNVFLVNDIDLEEWEKYRKS